MEEDKKRFVVVSRYFGDGLSFDDPTEAETHMRSLGSDPWIVDRQTGIQHQRYCRFTKTGSVFPVSPPLPKV